MGTMDATTGTAGPLQGVDDIDWGALAPERGSEIPELLRGVRGGDDPARSVATLYDILRFPGAGYPAAPTASGFLVDIACDPETADPGQALSLLLELVAPTAADHFPAASTWNSGARTSPGRAPPTWRPCGGSTARGGTRPATNSSTAG